MLGSAAFEITDNLHTGTNQMFNNHMGAVIQRYQRVPQHTLCLSQKNSAWHGMCIYQLLRLLFPMRCDLKYMQLWCKLHHRQGGTLAATLWKCQIRGSLSSNGECVCIVGDVTYTIVSHVWYWPFQHGTPFHYKNALQTMHILCFCDIDLVYWRKMFWLTLFW